MTRSLSLPSLVVVATLANLASAQGNTVPGRDLALENTSQIQRYRRTGSFPNGVQAIGMWTLVCNPGTSSVPFQQAMSPNHAFIHYIVARESAGRLVQISNWSWVKHTFGSSNDPSTCGTCVNQQTSSFVEVGCNDAYANTQAVDHFNLGPPSEIDPWLGTWNPVCSHFDMGNPPVAPAQQCDGVRSLTQTQANVLNQSIGDALRVYDDDLNVAGANFYYQSGYLVPGEAEALRGNNIGSRPFTATFSTTAGQWSLFDAGAFTQGTILQRWSGASINSSANGSDDGRYYVAVKVTGPTNGLYHYEYAVHNRDNKRGTGAFRIPICPDAQVVNVGFHDFDRNALTDWSGAKSGSEIVFQMNPLAQNPLRWNSIFNFWFDSDAAPQTGSVTLDQFDIGPGALTVAVGSTTPSGIFNQNLGAGCGAPAPSLYAVGTPDRALLGNASFSVRSSQNGASAVCAFVLSTTAGSTSIAPGCTVYTGDPLTLLGPVVVVADAAGVATLPLPVPNNPSLEGADLDFQMFRVTTGGQVLGLFDLSNGLRVRVGNLITACP